MEPVLPLTGPLSLPTDALPPSTLPPSGVRRGDHHHPGAQRSPPRPVSYTHLRAHETEADL
eukprot:2530978-Rhodomonas_salina.1